jgi:hypothetical protein
MPPLNLYSDVHCLKLGKCVLQFSLNHDNVLKSPSLNAILSSGERENSNITETGEQDVEQWSIRV